MIEVGNTNLLIEKKLVLDHIFHGYIRYNPTCKVKQYFKYYKYDLISVYYKKNTRYEALSYFHRTSKCSLDKEQKCSLFNSAYMF